MRPPIVRRQMRRLVTPVAVATVLALLMTACVSGDGGGGGGGNGDTGYILRVLMINAHSEPHTLTYSGGPPLPDSPDGETAESCTAIIVHYTVTVPFELLVDGVPVMISDELPEGVPFDGETDLIAVIDILEDGTAQPSQNQSSGGALEPGRQVGKPASVAICP